MEFWGYGFGFLANDVYWLLSKSTILYAKKMDKSGTTSNHEINLWLKWGLRLKFMVKVFKNKYLDLWLKWLDLTSLYKV